mmetsp:Transcript_36706/g.41787  ORF Transcript_36706/g.41787 Transcript_36706/m.41787 type:complete len:213 (+) Transcript_36706:57-695(+)
MVYVEAPNFWSESFHNSRINKWFNPFRQRDEIDANETYRMPKHGYISYLPSKYPSAVEWPRLSSKFTFEHNEHDDRAQMNTHEFSHGHIGLGGQIRYPRACIREMRKFESCERKNGAASCDAQKENIVAICPNWALDNMKDKKKWVARAESIDNATYRRAMEVSDYNQGRTVSDLEIKDWSYGTRKHLRPETLWADDRYDPKYWHESFKKSD